MDFRTILGTSSKRRLALLESLYYHREGWTSDQLLSELNCSLPILLNDIALINEEYPDFQITKLKNIYRLEVDKYVNLGSLYAKMLVTCPEFQIIEELLYEKCENIVVLSEKLFLSPANTQRYLKKIESVMSQAGMKLCYRPLRIEGNEGEIRHFYYRFYRESQHTFESTLPHLSSDQYLVIETYIDEFIEKNGIWKKYIFQKRLLYNFYISLWRIKNGHRFPKEALRSTGLELPETATYQALKQVTQDSLSIMLSPAVLRECLWLSFSDAVVFSAAHRQQALADNPKYQELYEQHVELVTEYNQLIGQHLTSQKVMDLATILSNDFYFQRPDGCYIGLLRRNRFVFLREAYHAYARGLEKIYSLAKHFTDRYQMYQDEELVWNYVYLLITAEADSLEWLARQENALKVLLLSDLSPTEETFLAKQIQENIYGNFTIHHLESALGDASRSHGALENYDCLITTGSAKGLPEDYPVVVIDPFLTQPGIPWIQAMISELSGKNRNTSVLE